MKKPTEDEIYTERFEQFLGDILVGVFDIRGGLRRCISRDFESGNHMEITECGFWDAVAEYFTHE